MDSGRVYSRGMLAEVRPYGYRWWVGVHGWATFSPTPSVGVHEAMASSSGFLGGIPQTMAWSAARYLTVNPDEVGR